MVIVLIFIASTFAISFFISIKTTKKPELYSISPQIGSSGDYITITGLYFGETQEDSYVEIGGNKLTQSCYDYWTNTSVRIVLPQNFQDGLVYIVTSAGRSEAKNFANRQTIPILVRSDPQITTPLISEIIAKNASIGSIITILGKNFGSLRSNSKVFFSAGTEENTDTEFIVCSETNPDYDYWSDSEIRVRIPDGSMSGSIYIETEKGISNNKKIALSSQSFIKKYDNKKTYLLSVSTDISNIVAIGEGTLTIRIPKPPKSASQRKIEIPVSTPEPAILDYMDTIVHQFPVNNEVTEKISINHSFVIPVYAVETSLSSKDSIPYSQTTLSLFSHYLKSNSVVLSDEVLITEIAKKVAKGNVYQKAKSLFDYILTEYTLLPEVNTNDYSLLNAIESKSGDAYDFALIFASLCRASGVICIPVSGVLIDANLQAKNHWWCEFYMENIGWIPVDISLAAGLPYEPFQDTFYKDKSQHFGNLDSQHVTFSRGWNEIKQTNIAGKTVFRPKEYALQSIWEETSTEVQSYSSFWSNVYVMGVY